MEIITPIKTKLSVKVARSYFACEELAKEILERQSAVLGFDVEATALFKVGISNPIVSTIQLSTDTSAYIFQVGSFSSLSKNLERILVSDTFVKVGLGSIEDSYRILDKFGIRVKGLIDIKPILQSKGFSACSLEEAARMFVDPSFEKKKHLGDWDEELTNSQITYAAVDAWISREVYFKIITFEGVFDIDVRGEKYDADSLLSWLTGYLGSEPRKRNTLINQIFNSYAPWRKMKEEERLNLINVRLDQLIKEGKLKGDGAAVSLPSSGNMHEEGRDITSSYPSSVLVTNNFLFRLNGLSVSSAINYTANSFQLLKGINMDLRKKWAQDAINELASKGVLKIEKGIVFLPS